MSREALMHTPPEPAALLSTVADINPLDAIKKLRSAAPALAAQMALQGQLFKVEWAEEKIRLGKLLAIGLLGFALFVCANLAIGALLAVLGWQIGYLIPALIGLALVYVLGVWLAWRKWQAVSALSVQAFATSRAELTADVALIWSKL